MSSRVFTVLLFSFYFIVTGFAQEEAGIKEDAFANFLYTSKLYDFASEEYERLLFYSPGNLDYLKKLIDCYKLSGKSELVSSRLQVLDHTDKDVILSYYDLLLISDNADKLDEYFRLQKGLFNNEERIEIGYKSAIGNREWKKSKSMFDQNPLLSKYQPIDDFISKSKFKSPGLASVMSVILPGAGRVYARDTKDGIISLLFVATTGFQSYRRFKNNGSRSVSAWIYGGISLGFYLSNIYGSYQSAKYYNNKLDEKIHTYSIPLLVDSRE